MPNQIITNENQVVNIQLIQDFHLIEVMTTDKPIHWGWFVFWLFIFWPVVVFMAVYNANCESFYKVKLITKHKDIDCILNQYHFDSLSNAIYPYQPETVKERVKRAWREV